MVQQIPKAICRTSSAKLPVGFHSTNWISCLQLASKWNAGRFLRFSFLPAFPALANQFNLPCRMGLMPDPVINPVQTSRMIRSQAIALTLTMEQWFSRCAEEPTGLPLRFWRKGGLASSFSGKSSLRLNVFTIRLGTVVVIRCLLMCSRKFDCYINKYCRSKSITKKFAKIAS